MFQAANVMYPKRRVIIVYDSNKAASEPPQQKVSLGFAPLVVILAKLILVLYSLHPKHGTCRQIAYGLSRPQQPQGKSEQFSHHP